MKLKVCSVLNIALNKILINANEIHFYYRFQTKTGQHKHNFVLLSDQYNHPLQQN